MVERAAGAENDLGIGLGEETKRDAYARTLAAGAATKDLIAYTTEKGAAICVHGRQLTVCAVCIAEMEQRLRERRALDEEQCLLSRPESLLEAFARDPAVQEILRAKTRPSGERRGEDLSAMPELASSLEDDRRLGRGVYKLSEDLLPAGEELPPAKIQPGQISKPSGETLSSYSAALFAISGALSLVHSLLHGEQMRTPVGGRAWETLGVLGEELSEISEALRAEMARCSGGEGFVA